MEEAELHFEAGSLHLATLWAGNAMISLGLMINLSLLGGHIRPGLACGPSGSEKAPAAGWRWTTPPATLTCLGRS